MNIEGSIHSKNSTSPAYDRSALWDTYLSIADPLTPAPPQLSITSLPHFHAANVLYLYICRAGTSMILPLALHFSYKCIRLYLYSYPTTRRSNTIPPSPYIYISSCARIHNTRSISLPEAVVFLRVLAQIEMRRLWVHRSGTC